MDSDLRSLIREWEGSHDPNTLPQLANMMLRQGELAKWEQVLTKLNVFSIEPRMGEGEALFSQVDFEWSLTNNRRKVLYELGKQIWRNFEKRRFGAWTAFNLKPPLSEMPLALANYVQLREFLTKAVILKESHPRSEEDPGGIFELTSSGLKWEKDFIARDHNGYYLIRAIATHQDQGTTSTWEEFAAHPKTQFRFIIEFLPFAKLVPKILDQKSNLNNVIEFILSRSQERNPTMDDLRHNPWDEAWLDRSVRADLIHNAFNADYGQGSTLVFMRIFAEKLVIPMLASLETYYYSTGLSQKKMQKKPAFAAIKYYRDNGPKTAEKLLFFIEEIDKEGAALEISDNAKPTPSLERAKLANQAMKNLLLVFYNCTAKPSDFKKASRFIAQICSLHAMFNMIPQIASGKISSEKDTQQFIYKHYKKQMKLLDLTVKMAKLHDLGGHG